MHFLYTCVIAFGSVIALGIMGTIISELGFWRVVKWLSFTLASLMLVIAAPGAVGVVLLFMSAVVGLCAIAYWWKYVR
jgi:hypothetical protein